MSGDHCLRLAVLGNAKCNSARLLLATVRRLAANGMTFAVVRYYDKHYFASNASSDLIAEIAAENDIALTAVGDCAWSCTTCVDDAIRLEKAGIPTVAIVTTEFALEARLQCEMRGMARLDQAVFTHPMSGLTLDQLEGRAAEIAPQARLIWFGDTGSEDMAV
ncbi:UGSC family (seleno)protein [Mycobacterium sp. ML4]